MNEPMTNGMLTDDEREIITEEYIRSVKRELVKALAEIAHLRAREQALDAENEQKQAQIDAMRPMVDAVADHIGVYVSEHFRQCAFCGNGALESRIIAHADDCEVTQARGKGSDDD